MLRAERRRIQHEFQKVKILPSDEKLTAQTGLGVALEILTKSPMMKEMVKTLPERVSHRSVGTWKLFACLIAAHLEGVESIQNMEELEGDPYLESLIGASMPAPRTIVDYLADFEEHHIEGLNTFINQMGFALHSFVLEAHPELVTKNRIIDIDSTYHVHHGELFDGVAWNYKNEWSLESQSAFSSLGFCHHVWLRPGNTKSGTDANQMIRNIFDTALTSKLRHFFHQDFVRMDSAFCDQNTIHACLERGTHFTITANKATTFWHKLLEVQGVAWTAWVHDEKTIKQHEKAGYPLPQIEVGRIWWEPRWANGTLRFPILVKRTWKSFCKLKERHKVKSQGELFNIDTVEESGGWEYYAVVTNHDLTKSSYQDIMEFHQKRASSENMNKEQKFGYHLNNFPCQSLTANKAWMMSAMIAHNLLRFLSLMNDPVHPQFARKTRRKFINFPARLAERSRQIFLHVPLKFYQEVIQFIEGWRFPEKVFAHMFSTA